MKKYLPGVALVVLFGAIACSKKPETSSELHDPQHEHTATKEVSTNDKAWSKPTKKFVVDDNLKVRMEKILEIMKAVHASESKPVLVQDIPQTGKNIEATVKDIFKNCKLTPDADAAIHPILAELLKGAGLLKNGEKKEGHNIIHNALLRYEDFFDHPGWNHK